MTDRLYYRDAYSREFDAAVTRIEPRDDGRLLVELDRTCFYPTSGGQPFDTGTLAGTPVVEVIDLADGVVGHLIERPGSLAPGQAVHGVIDWACRFDHMQQHSGQHVLSAAFDRMYSVETMSFHLGAEASTIDLAREVTPEQIAAAEREANLVVWDDRPVSVRFVDWREAGSLPLRKPPADRTGPLRLVEIDGFDLSACGGTHVARTGAIGLIAVGGWERFKGGQRIEFRCGGRALRRHGDLRDTVAAGTRLLSVGPAELPGAIERVQMEARDLRRAVSALRTDLVRYRAGELAASAERIDREHRRGRLVVDVVEADAPGLKALAAAVVSRPAHVAVLFSTSTPRLVVIARSDDLALQAQTALAELIGRFGGRGGGKPDLAQGGGLDAGVEAIREAARAAILAAWS
jgi:alanyl-tRNA synthetase